MFFPVPTQYNYYFALLGELLNIRIPNRFYETNYYDQNKIDKNFEAVIRGVEKRLRVNKEEVMTRTVDDIKNGAIRSMQSLGDYCDQLVEYAISLENMVKENQKTIEELKGITKELVKEEDAV